MNALSPFDHAEIKRLLPWYITGALGEMERASVSEHLIGCAQCRADLQAEETLSSEIPRLALDIDVGWAALQRQMGRHSGRVPQAALPFRHMALAATLASVLVTSLFFLARPVRQPAAEYRTLGAAVPAMRGNLLVQFRPEAKTGATSALIAASGARIVDGPTATGALILAAPAAQRITALAALRGRPEVELAEPIDP